MEDVLTVLWGFEGKLRLTFHKVYWKDKIRSTFVIVFSKEILNLNYLFLHIMSSQYIEKSIYLLLSFARR